MVKKKLKVRCWCVMTRGQQTDLKNDLRHNIPISIIPNNDVQMLKELHTCNTPLSMNLIIHFNIILRYMLPILAPHLAPHLSKKYWKLIHVVTRILWVHVIKRKEISF